MGFRNPLQRRSIGQFNGRAFSDNPEPATRDVGCLQSDEVVVLLDTCPGLDPDGSCFGLIGVVGHIRSGAL